MRPMKIVADRDIPYLKGVLEPYANIEYIKGVEIAPNDVADADALIIRTRTRCDEALLGGSKVKFIGTATIGFDHIDTTYCAEHGITVFAAAGCNAKGVLNWESAALAYIAHKKRFMPKEKTIGVVGVGHVGSLISEYAHRWGFSVLCCDPPRQRVEGGDFVTLEKIVAEADIITFHVPLNRGGIDRTFHIADSDFFNSIKQGAIIINSSRGEVINTQSLKNALSQGQCECVIDTWENEPNIDANLVAQSLLATPHIAGYSEQGKAKATSMVINEISRIFGLPLNNWYPSDAATSVTAAISWNELMSTIFNYYDIAADSNLLKSDITQFEALRNNYKYRQEYY